MPQVDLQWCVIDTCWGGMAKDMSSAESYELGDPARKWTAVGRYEKCRKSSLLEGSCIINRVHL